MTEKNLNQNQQEKKEFSAGIIIYRNTPQGPKFLLLYHGGKYWNFPKGHIENLKNAVISLKGEVEEISVRETSKEAAIRETWEETGIDSSKLSIKRNFRAVEKFRFRRNGEQIFKIVVFYLAETNEVEVKISSKHNGFGWFQYKDAKQILTPYKGIQRLLRISYEYINPRPPLRMISRPKPTFSKTRDASQQFQPKPSDQA